LLSNPNVLTVSYSNSLPTRVGSSTTAEDWTGSPEDAEMTIYFNNIGYEFLDVYNIPIALGRGFSPEFVADDSLQAVIINETAYRAFGWEDLDNKFVKERPVVGVVKDFYMHSFKLEVMPLMMGLDNDGSSNLSIRIAEQNQQETAAFIEETLAGMSRYPVTVRYVDDIFQDMYASEQKFGSIVTLFTLLALIIGALGLFGLVAYTAETRTKEIGVRKTLGASIPSILGLFARDYAGLIVVAGLVGVPVAWYAMSEWLDQFVYRIDLGPMDFILSVLLLVLVAMVSMVWQALKASMTDPVRALRYE
jgi:putative ABC transport system permease protein